MKLFIGKEVPEDMFVFFADLTAYKCVVCDHTYASGMVDIKEGQTAIQVKCASICDSFGRPVGLVCDKCKPRFNNFVYREGKDV